MTAKNTVLILPFTSGILRDPSALLPVIFEAAQEPTESLTVVFSTPGPGKQLYTELRAAPKAHFEELQRFLGKVYAALAAGQWTANRVLLSVEVRFDGELGDWSAKLQAVPDEIVRVEGELERADSADSAQATTIWARTLSLRALRTRGGGPCRRASFPGTLSSRPRRRWAVTPCQRSGARLTTCTRRTRS